MYASHLCPHFLSSLSGIRSLFIHLLTHSSFEGDLSSNWAKPCGFRSGNPSSGQHPEPGAPITSPSQQQPVHSQHDREWVSNILNGYLNVSDEWIFHDEAVSSSVGRSKSVISSCSTLINHDHESVAPSLGCQPSIFR